MNYPVVTLVACIMMAAASKDAAAGLNCHPSEVEACKKDAAKLCRGLPRKQIAKCLDDLTDDCATPTVLCKPLDPGDAFKPRRPRTIRREDPMVIVPEDR
jgi:hypothetical protein